MSVVTEQILYEIVTNVPPLMAGMLLQR